MIASCKSGVSTFCEEVKREGRRFHHCKGRTSGSKKRQCAHNVYSRMLQTNDSVRHGGKSDCPAGKAMCSLHACLQTFGEALEQADAFECKSSAEDVEQHGREDNNSEATMPGGKVRLGEGGLMGEDGDKAGKSEDCCG